MSESRHTYEGVMSNRLSHEEIRVFGTNARYNAHEPTKHSRLRASRCVCVCVCVCVRQKSLISAQQRPIFPHVRATMLTNPPYTRVYVHLGVCVCVCVCACVCIRQKSRILAQKSPIFTKMRATILTNPPHPRVHVRLAVNVC